MVPSSPVSTSRMSYCLFVRPHLGRPDCSHTGHHQRRPWPPTGPGQQVGRHCLRCYCRPGMARMGCSSRHRRDRAAQQPASTSCSVCWPEAASWPRNPSTTLRRASVRQARRQGCGAECHEAWTRQLKLFPVVILTKIGARRARSSQLRDAVHVMMYT